MKIITETQGDQAWFDARKGKITASDARYALAGKHTKGRRNYIENIADEQPLTMCQKHGWYGRGACEYCIEALEATEQGESDE